ncbi:uncharacterized protein QC763_508460 [Podospora pseudopauciseta]|uniref:Uncharacterized protein n=1 Tax=Podospora pseudopauciseta TaxID=2093780 RepID=A0ABR0H9Y8_9PEZI|nr:hypothetical protein QC763_508460 [Podospora pseudopauciseta]
MHTIHSLLLALASLAVLVMAEGNVLFPYMYGLNYTEYDEAKKLGLTRTPKAYACKSEDEWNKMTTADFAKYKSIIVPDCLCNTSLGTIKFLDNTKKVWSPAVTGNMVLIGTDPSYHSKWYKLAGASAMIRDSISLASTGKNGTGMYFSLSCYYQSNAASTTIEALSEIGVFKVRGNLTCLNKVHIVATDDSMTSLTDEMASNWNCSAHEVFAEYPTEGNGAFEPLAIALNTTGLGQRTFADGTHGTPYIIARGATPLGCGNNVTEAAYNEECDYGKAVNGMPDSLCSSSCKCLFGMISPGLCRENTTSSSSTSISSSSTTFHNTSSIALSTGSPTNTSLSTSMLYTNTSSPQTKTRKPPVTITVWPSRPPWVSSSSQAPTPSTASSNTTRSDPDTPTVIVTASWPPSPSSDVATDAEPGTVIITASNDPGSGSPSFTTSTPPAPSSSPSNSDDSSGSPETVVVTASNNATESEPGTVTVLPPSETPTGSMGGTSSVSYPTVTVTAGGPDSGGQVSSSASGSETPPVTVTATAEVPGVPADGQIPTLSDTTSYPPGTDEPSWSLTTTTGSEPQVTLTVRPSGESGSGGASGSETGTMGGSSSLGLDSSMTGSGTMSGSGKPTVTVYPSGQTSGGGDGNGPGASSAPGVSPTPGLSSAPGSSSSGGDVSGTASGKSQSTVTVYPSGQSSGAGGGDSPGVSPAPTTALSSSRTTVTVYPSGQSSGGGDVGNGPSASSASESASGSSRSTVTVYPSGSSSGGGDSGNGPGISETRSTKTMTVGESSVTAPGAPDSSSSTNRGLGSTSYISGSLTNTATGGGGMGTASGTSAVSSETGASDPLSGSSTGGTGSAAGSATGSPGTSGSGGPASSDSATGGASGSGTPGSPSSSGSPSSFTPSTPPSLTGSITTSTLSATPSTQSSSVSTSGTASAPSSNQPSGSSSETSYSPGDTSATSSNQGGTTTSTQTTSNSGSLSGSNIPLPTSDCDSLSPSPSPTSQCDTWIGIEIIHIIEIVEICPSGSTVTETKTEHLSTLTRPICATPTPSQPCYPCIFGTPSASDDNFTVTVTSCPANPKTTVTVTAQMCSTCTVTTWVGTVPGHTPGGECHGCLPHASSTVTETAAVETATEVVTLGSVVSDPAATSSSAIGGGGGGGGEGYGQPPPASVPRPVATASSVPAGGYGPPPLPDVPVDGATASDYAPYKPSSTSFVVTAAGVGRRGHRAVTGVLAGLLGAVMVM